MTARLPSGRLSVCQECGATYEIKNTLSRFCTSACSQRAWRKARPGYQSAATARYLAASAERQEHRREYMAEYRQRPDVIARRKELQRQRYRREPDELKRRAQLAYERITRFLTEIKTTAGCIDCGTRGGVLHFDHRPGTVKLFNPSSGRGRKRVTAEIAKCDVRCASCHARRHEQEKRERAV